MKRLLPLLALLVLGCDRSATNLTASATPSTVALSARFLANSVASVDSVEARLVRTGHSDSITLAKYVQGGSLALGKVSVGESFKISMAGFDNPAGVRANIWWGEGSGSADGSSANLPVDITTTEIGPPVSAVNGTVVGSSIALAAGTWYTTDGSDPRTSKTAQQSTGSVTIDKACTVKAATKAEATGSTPALWSDVISTTFQDTGTTKQPVLSSDAALTDIAPSVGSLSPKFSSTNLSYAVTLPAGTSSIQLTATRSDANATVTATFAKDGSSVIWPVTVTDSITVNLAVTAQDGKTTKVYAVKLVPSVVSVIKSSDATLANIAPSAGSLSPKFDAKTMSYAVALPAGFDTARVAVTKSDVNASIAATLKDGSAVSWPVKVSDSTAVNLTVTAQDGMSTQTYAVLFRKAAVAKPVLTRVNPANDTTVSNPTTSLAFKAGVSSAHLKSVTIGGKTAALSGDSWAGTVSGLATGANTIWAVATDSTGGKDSVSWTITRPLSSDATLSSLKPSAGSLASAFETATEAYTLNLPAGWDTARVAFTTSEANANVVATLAKDGSAVSWPVKVTDPVTVNLKVTAQDGKTSKTYAVTFQKAALVIPTLTRAFPSSADTTIPNATTKMTFRVNVVSAHLKSVTIGGVATTVQLNNRIAVINLAAGVNTIWAVATDSTGGKDSVSWTVTRALSSDASLSNLKGSAGTLSPAFVPTTLAYALTIYGTDTARLVPTLSEANAKVEATLKDGSAVTWPLKVTDSTTVNLKVTAQDGTTSQTYSVAISKSSQIVVQCSLPTGSVITHPTFPIFSLASGVDTTGIKLLFTKDGTDPVWTTATAKIARSTPLWVGVAGPSTVKVSPWKDGVQIGPVQTFTWTASTVTYDFNTIDTGSIGDEPTAISSVGVYGYTWATESGSTTPTRPASTISTGYAFKLAYTVTGTDYPSSGFGLMVPWDPISTYNQQDFTKLYSITLTFKDTRTGGSSLKPLRIDLNSSETNATLYAAQITGISYGWDVSATSGVKKTITLLVSAADFPAWATSTPTDPVATTLKNFQSLKFNEGCLGAICTNVSGAIEVDDITFTFK